MSTIQVTTYAAAHLRVVRERGDAAAHRCARCPSPADEWAYDHTDSRELLDDVGRPYSLNPNFYLPLCRPCHRRFDAQQRDREQPQPWWAS
jgi:hypothetical protein